MAAVLCKGCANACEGLFKLLTVPCKLFGECCGTLTEGIAQLCTNPFCFFVVVSLAINIPSITAGITSVTTYGLGCMGTTWQIANVAFCAINIIAAFYIAMRFKYLQENPAQSSSGTNTLNSGMRKVSDILCYDPFVAIYILILIGFFTWLGIGVSWRANGQMWCGDGGSIALSNTSLACGYSFFGTGFFALSFSICCSCCCCNDDRRGHEQYYSEHYYGSTASAPNRSSHHSSHVHQRPVQQHTNNSSIEQHYNDVEYASTKPVTATVVGSQQATVEATVVDNGVSPTALPMPTDGSQNSNGLSIDQEADAVAKGSAFGAKVGKFFNVNNQTKSKLETAGAKTNVAVNQGLFKAQQLIGMKK